MRVIEQLVQHFWARGALTREEALYLVRHGFVREADLPGLVERPPEPETDEIEVPPQLRDEPPDPRFDPKAREHEELEDELTGRAAGGGKKGGKKKKAGHNLAPAAAVLAAHLAAREPYPAILELGSRIGRCATWRDAALRVAAATPAKLEAALVGLLNKRPPALGELWFWFDLEALFVWTEEAANAGPVADGIGKLLRADTPGHVGRLEQLKKAHEVRALVDLLAARRPFLATLPVLYEDYFDRLALWLVPPAGAALASWPPLPWAFVIVYNAHRGTEDAPPPGYHVTPDTGVIRDALRTAFPMAPVAVRELLLHHLRHRPDPIPDEHDLSRNMVFDRPLHCPFTWKV
jgi:hypothetical protein